jgi:hypothetical protein
LGIGNLNPVKACFQFKKGSLPTVLQAFAGRDYSSVVQSKAAFVGSVEAERNGPLLFDNEVSLPLGVDRGFDNWRATYPGVASLVVQKEKGKGESA